MISKEQIDYFNNLIKHKHRELDDLIRGKEALQQRCEHIFVNRGHKHKCNICGYEEER